MTDSSGYKHVRPHNVGPHDVKKDEKGEATPRQQPEKAYNTEVGEHAALSGAGRPKAGAKATPPPKED